LAPLPELVNVDDLADPERDVLMTLSTTVDGQVFIPGLYRMLAHWPAWLARVAAELVSVRDVADHACVELAEGIDALIPALMQGLPISDPPLTGGAAEAANVVDAIDRYRETSPQMVVYCKMLKSSLPPVMPLT
jgi:hypothetical protein